MGLSRQEKQEFVRRHHHAVLITRRADGRLQTSPIVCGLHDDGRVAISVTEDRAKTKNLGRDPRATLCVLPDKFFGEWVQIDGTAEIVPTADAIEGLVALYRQISGEHPDWDDYRAAMVRDQRVLLLISIDE
ncbi:MAG TPA: PPOX class F420-dependent oxidoreductase [Acidimicrobiales bacterium]|nr:PPOX class F420-dependent oxidoreductase [Acidimicrobiales bacterium]